MAIYDGASRTEAAKIDGVTCSMSRSGNVWNNVAMESFFSSLKTERTARKVYRTRDQARADVFDYIELFYNPRRRHSTIEGVVEAEPMTKLVGASAARSTTASSDSIQAPVNGSRMSPLEPAGHRVRSHVLEQMSSALISRRDC